MADWSKFNEKIDLAKLKSDIESAKKKGGNGDYTDVEAGQYHGKVERLEIKSTKDGRPMLSVMFRITEGERKRACLFMNRVLYGTKNDANMINSAIGWLETLEPSEDIGPIFFDNYNQFEELVLDIAEDIAELKYDIEYDPDDFNPIHVEGVYE